MNAKSIHFYQTLNNRTDHGILKGLIADRLAHTLVSIGVFLVFPPLELKE